MVENFDQSPYTKKAFELAYAMLRLAPTVKEVNASRYLEEFAHRLLGVFTRGEYDNAPFLIEEIAWFVRLWTDTQVIHSHLGESLIIELGKLKELSCEIRKKDLSPQELKDILPSSDLLNSVYFRKTDSAKEKPAIKPRSVSLPNDSQSFHYDASSRQSAIISFFESRLLSGNELATCRMKDIQEKFPSVSERTLRYDLQKMVEQGMLQRVGAGPMSAYRLSAPAQVQSVTVTSPDRYII